MGEMVEVYKIMKEEDKARKKRNLVDNQKIVTQPGWVKHTDYHYTYVLNGKHLNFWPSRNKWQWDGKVHTGDLAGFIKNREKK